MEGESDRGRKIEGKREREKEGRLHGRRKGETTGAEGCSSGVEYGRRAVWYKGGDVERMAFINLCRKKRIYLGVGSEPH